MSIRTVTVSEGVDISAHKPKHVTDVPLHFDLIVALDSFVGECLRS